MPRSSDCQTVADTSRVVGSCWLCGAHRTRAAAVACENRGNPFCFCKNNKRTIDRDRGTPSSAIHTTSDALHAFCAIHTISSFDGAALDANVMARNVCRDLVFEASSHDACSHSDLGGCADGTAEALPARQTASIRCWHERCNCLDCHEFSSTPLRFRPHPRMPMQLSFECQERSNPPFSHSYDTYDTCNLLQSK